MVLQTLVDLHLCTQSFDLAKTNNRSTRTGLYTLHHKGRPWLSVYLVYRKEKMHLLSCVIQFVCIHEERMRGTFKTSSELMNALSKKGSTVVQIRHWATNSGWFVHRMYETHKLWDDFVPKSETKHCPLEMQHMSFRIHCEA